MGNRMGSSPIDRTRKREVYNLSFLLSEAWQYSLSAPVTVWSDLTAHIHDAMMKYESRDDKENR